MTMLDVVNTVAKPQLASAAHLPSLARSGGENSNGFVFMPALSAGPRGGCVPPARFPHGRRASPPPDQERQHDELDGDRDEAGEPHVVVPTVVGEGEHRHDCDAEEVAAKNHKSGSIHLAPIDPSSCGLLAR
jgi:hypothetical protein